MIRNLLSNTQRIFK